MKNCKNKLDTTVKDLVNYSCRKDVTPKNTNI